MTVFLLIVIVAILLFGAAVVRGVIQYALLGAIGLILAIPILVWLFNNPEYYWTILVIALAGLALRFWSDDNIKKNKRQGVWDRYSKSIEKYFDGSERAMVTKLWDAGEMNAFQEACKRIEKGAKLRSMSKDERKAHQKYLKDQYKQATKS